MQRIMLCLMLVFTAALGIQAQEHQPLMTRWAADVSPDNVLPEYPRPQMVRDEWLNLNGLWEYGLTRHQVDETPEFNGEILVPFPIESALSGVQQRIRNQRLWYKRTFTVPETWQGQRVLLHFGAVDWQATVWVNGVELGMHRGGYDAFSFDITDALNSEGEQEIIVDVWDPTEGTQPRGKQVHDPDAIWYTPTTGIWQTVWLEPVSAAHITGLKMATDIDAGVLTLETHLSDGATTDSTIQADVMIGEEMVATGTGSAGEALEITIENPQLWSPDSPFLYDLQVSLIQGDEVVDTVSSYFGMRKIAVQPDENGVPRLWLNNQPLFQFGLLDQGFWPDGLYTAPTDEALRYDIEITRQLGFNLIRKHVKVEPARWYYWADRLGVLVWQDMPSGGDDFAEQGAGEISRSARSAEQFELELQAMIDGLYNHPSIVMWVIFNEGWGQYDTARLADWVAEYDPTRLVNSASGWNDVGAGDVFDIHRYPGPDAPPADPDRASVLGEFGGLGLPVADHTWLAQESWGYAQFEDTESLMQAYTRLIENLRQLQTTGGLAAAIYTQTTDVETEVNGMMTYDREIIKLPVEQLYEINSSLYQQSVEASN